MAQPLLQPAVFVLAEEAVNLLLHKAKARLSQ